MAGKLAFIALQQFCEADDQPQRLLEEAGWTVRRNTFGRRLRKEDMVELLKDADAVVAGVEPYGAALFVALPQLRCISRCGVGTDAIDLEAAQRGGIAVYTTADEVVEPVAELTVAMILALARNLPQHLRHLREGRWTKQTGVLLSEWTIGLVGFGRIGQAVERMLRVFQPRVVIADPRIAQIDLPAGIEKRGLSTLLAESDVVSLHANCLPGADPLIGREQLRLMKPGSLLVNTARGFLVDEAALEEALRTGHLAGAALDVFAHEPYVGPLTQFPNVLCTPHVATLTCASRAAMERRAAQHVVEHFARSHALTAVRGGCV